LELALLTDVARERARVDALDGHHAALLEEFGETSFGAPRARELGRLAHHQRLGKEPARLEEVGAHAVVADQGISEGDDLPGVRGIAQDLLIPGHRRVEDDFAVGLALGAQAAAAEDAPVLERQDGFVLEADGRAHRTPAMGEARRKVSRPSSQVPSTRPVRRAPAKGVARPLVANFSGSTVHSASGSKATRSAGPPRPAPAYG